jgi:hypothetical protein
MTVLLYDNFETFTGWTTYGTGAVSQSSTQAYSGTYSLAKTTSGDPNGGFKLLDVPAIRSTIRIEAWIFSESPRVGGTRDKISIVDSNFNGYGISLSGTGFDTLDVERRTAGPATVIASTTLVKPENTWYRVEFISNVDNTFTVNAYSDTGSLLGTLTSGADTTHTGPFDRVLVAGGYNFYVDELTVEGASALTGATVAVGTITPASGSTVFIESGTQLAAAGSPIQTLYYRTDARTVYSAPNSGNGTTVTDLNLTITPKFSNSLIIMTWMIHGEMHYDSVWTLHRDGSLITTAGYQGFNNQIGNSRWSGVVATSYDFNDQSSTPFHLFIQYAIPAENTATRTYAPAVRSSSGTAYTFYLNRTVASAGADSYEVGVSTGVIMEIMQ